MASVRATMVSMGLTKDYVPNMGTWEAARELAANCKDADDNYQTFTVRDNDDFLEFRTKTKPRVAEVILLGCGASRLDDDKIGQFGEGFKLAALIATRQRGGQMVVFMPEHRVEFAFKDVFGERVLHAKVYDADPTDWDYDNCQFVCHLIMPKVRTILDGKIRPGSTSCCWDREPQQPTTVFCKGIFIQDVPNVDSLYCYNLNSITLNRDRSMASESSLLFAVASLILYHMTEDIADSLIGNPNCWEVLALDRYGLCYNDKPKKLLAAAFRKQFGDEAVLAHDRPSVNEMATLRGHRVIHVPKPIAALIHDLPPTPTDPHAPDARVRTAHDVLPKDVNLTTIANMAAYEGDLNEIHKILDLLDIHVSLQIFCAEDEKLQGMCCWTTNGATLWLQEHLFTPGSRLERFRTVFHELAHADASGAPDGSFGFEASLDKLGGKLAIAYLNEAAIASDHKDPFTHP